MKPLKQIKNVADSYMPGVLSTLKRGKIKWWKLYIIFVEPRIEGIERIELDSYFRSVVTVNDTEKPR